MNVHDKITKARAGLVLDQPFFGSLALRLKMTADETCKTAWTDGESLGYNPAWVEGLSLEEIKGVLAHEVMHLACAHHARRGGREQRKWNVAGDYAINQILEDAGMSLPRGRLLDPAFKDLAAEEIFGRLPDEQQGGVGNDPGGCGEIRDGKTGPDGKIPTPGEMTESEQEWKVATTQAAQTARAMGRMPGSIERMIGKMLEAHVDWREVLRRFIDQTCRNDYTWTRANRRYLSTGLYLPSLHSEELRPVVVAVDTSMSINNEALDQFAAEITAILEEQKTSCDVLYCDTKIQGHEQFSSEHLPVVLHPHGGGGTDFRPSFVWVETKNMRPSCLIYLTDMECNRFPEPPEYPVLWVKYGKYGTPAPFGEEVKI